jgi:hypothetical protein
VHQHFEIADFFSRFLSKGANHDNESRDLKTGPVSPCLTYAVLYFYRQCFISSFFIQPQKKTSSDYYGFPVRDEVSHRGGISSILKRNNLKNNVTTNLPVVANKIMTPTARRGESNLALIYFTNPFTVENADV